MTLTPDHVYTFKPCRFIGTFRKEHVKLKCHHSLSSRKLALDHNTDAGIVNQNVRV